MKTIHIILLAAFAAASVALAQQGQFVYQCSRCGSIQTFARPVIQANCPRDGAPMYRR